MLPSYETVAGWMGADPSSAPTRRPTRKGLARYIAACLYRETSGILWPEWEKIYMCCSRAYEIAEQEFHFRVPYDTFVNERIRAQEMLFREGRGGPRWDAAYAWATRRK